MLMKPVSLLPMSNMNKETLTYANIANHIFFLKHYKNFATVYLRYRKEASQNSNTLQDILNTGLVGK